MDDLGKIDLKKIKIKINPEDVTRAGIIIGSALATATTGGAVAPALIAAGSQVLKETGKRFMEREITSKLKEPQKSIQPASTEAYQIQRTTPETSDQNSNTRMWLIVGIVLIALLLLLSNRRKE
jgi:ABC-type phosphate transport system permease subunit